MEKSKIDYELISALDSMVVPDLSNLLFDGKGEIELNRRLSMKLESGIFTSRVEFSVPFAEGSRNRTDIVMFDKETHNVRAYIECKSCITPDVFQRLTKNNNFSKLLGDTINYRLLHYTPLYVIMWTIHWDEMNVATTTRVEQFKYFINHRNMHLKGFSLSEIKGNIISNFNEIGLGDVIHQCSINSWDVCRGSRASVIATLSRVF